MEKPKYIFPHSLLIFLLKEYDSPNRMTRLNNFIISEKIGNSPSVIASKTKDILNLLEKEENYLIWYVSKQEMYTSKDHWKELEPDKVNFATGIETLENNRVSAQLTIKGIGYTEKLLRENKQFKSVIRTNKFSRISMGATIIFSCTVLTVQIMTYQRNKEQRYQELTRLKIDSAKEAQRQLQSSMLFQILLHQHLQDSLKTAKP